MAQNSECFTSWRFENLSTGSIVIYQQSWVLIVMKLFFWSIPSLKIRVTSENCPIGKNTNFLPKFWIKCKKSHLLNPFTDFQTLKRLITQNFVRNSMKTSDITWIKNKLSQVLKKTLLTKSSRIF